MMLVEETSVPTEALPVAHFKEHLRLGTGFAEVGLQDVVLESFLRAAMAAIEARTGKILLSRSFSWSLTAWRGADEQALPVGPVSAITSVALVSRDGAEGPLSPESYRLERDMQRPKLRSTGCWLPQIPLGGSARIGFEAGFGSAWRDIPADLTQAVLLLGAHYYEYRHETSLGDGCMPFGVTALIERYRTVRIFGGGRL